MECDKIFVNHICDKVQTAKYIMNLYNSAKKGQLNFINGQWK